MVVFAMPKKNKKEDLKEEMVEKLQGQILTIHNLTTKQLQ